jgi:hypothetical protein
MMVMVLEDEKKQEEGDEGEKKIYEKWSCDIWILPIG